VKAAATKSMAIQCPLRIRWVSGGCGGRGTGDGAAGLAAAAGRPEGKVGSGRE